MESVADKDDPQTLAIEQHTWEKRDSPAPIPKDFDERAYVEAFPDVARAIENGTWDSALQHFQLHGYREDRLSDTRYRSAILGNTRTFPSANVDLILCSSGYCFASGWVVDDESAPLSELALVSDASEPCITTEFARCRRPDAEAAGRVSSARHVGFWTLMSLPPDVGVRAGRNVRLSTPNERCTFSMQEKWVSNEQLRDITFDYFGAAAYSSDPQAEACIQLDTGIGRRLIDLNLQICQRMALGAFPLRFGRQRAQFEGSIVVCLYAKPEFLALQAALFSECQGCDRYEFIYVSNSPELAERLIKDATIATRIYDLTITLVILPGNVGFGIANNVAVGYARSDRVLIVNPDVFPREAHWPDRHRQLLESLPEQQTRLFGVPLYYDNGSLMHAGMYFDSDQGLAIGGDRVIRREMIRVEHYGKGAPPGTTSLLRSRRVPAVTGAFMSVDRAWFEKLGGFSAEYVYGHYEDADFCLRSRQGGAACWLHNLPFWHFEGHGSRQESRHTAGSRLNRWYFTRTWSEVLHAGLLGPTPPALCMDPSS